MHSTISEITMQQQGNQQPNGGTQIQEIPDMQRNNENRSVQEVSTSSIIGGRNEQVSLQSHNTSDRN